MRKHELRRVPQLVAEVPIAFDALEVEGEVPALGGQGAEREAQGVGAVGVDAVRIFAPRAFGDLRGQLRLGHVRGALGDEALGGDAVHDVQRVQAVALRLGHLRAFGIAHHAVDVDLAERHLAGEAQGHHDHAGDPEEDDVVAGHQHAGGVEGVQFRRLLRPAEGAEGPQRGGKPRVQHVVVLAQRHVLGQPALGPRLGFAAPHVDVAGVVVPRRNPMPPPLLAADAPVLDVAHPREVHVLVLLRHELDGAVLHRFDGRLRERGDLHEPLRRQPRLDDRLRAVSPGHGRGMVFDALEQAGGVDIFDHALARLEAVEAAIGGGR